MRESSTKLGIKRWAIFWRGSGSADSVAVLMWRTATIWNVLGPFRRILGGYV